MIGEAELRVLAERDEGRYTVRFAGPIDLATVGRFEEAIRQATGVAEPVVAVDLSGVDFIDSTGITALVQMETSARFDVDRIRFHRTLDPKVEAVLRMSGVYEELNFIESEQG